jgi:tight adherence protein C
VSGDLTLVIGMAAVFIGIVLALSTIGSLTAERAQVNRSLAAVEAIRTAPASMRRELDRPFGERVVGPFFSRLIAIGRRFTPTHRAERVRRQLDVAGNPPHWDIDRVVAFKVLGVIVGFLVAVLVPLVLQLGVMTTLGVVAVLVPLGWFLPTIVLYQLGAKRTQKMRQELPDAMDLLTISVEAGLGFDAALSQVARNTTGPLAEEFFRVLQEMQIGMGRLEALRALGERNNLGDLRSFVTAMVQADAFGIPIANVLRVQSAEMRVKRRQRAEETAQKIPVKILFPLIFFMLPALFIVVAGPGVIQIIDTLL